VDHACAVAPPVQPSQDQGPPADGAGQGHAPVGPTIDKCSGSLPGAAPCPIKVQQTVQHARAPLMPTQLLRDSLFGRGAAAAAAPEERKHRPSHGRRISAGAPASVGDSDAWRRLATELSKAVRREPRFGALFVKSPRPRRPRCGNASQLRAD
jgi:hypothetical protein